MQGDEERNRKTGQNITLQLQFLIGDEANTVTKEVRLEVDKAFNPEIQDMNPYRVINHLTAAILKMLGGNRSLVADKVDSGHRNAARMKHTLTVFTPRELEVLDILLTGATNQDIAQNLGISTNTVKFHVKNILEKLQLKSRVELAAKFNQLGSSE